MSEKDQNVYMLEGIAEVKGGLVLKKKQNDDVDTFKKPVGVSLLGLDKLASIRKQEKLNIVEKAKLIKNNSYENDLKKPKNYRKATNETPTHTGGVSYEAKQRAEERYEKFRERRIHASSKMEKKNRNENTHLKYRDQKKSSTPRKSDYMNKPYRSYRHNSESPRFRDEPKTPNYKLKNPTSKTTWDEDEAETIKRSSWDFPTPNTHKSSLDWSERKASRSERNKKVEESSRPTPAFKYNYWTKDRKKTGATPSFGEA